MKLVTASAIMALFFAPAVSLSKQLTLENYLQEVMEKNQSFTAGQLSIEGAEYRKNENSLLFKPSIFAQTQTAIDKKPTANVNAQGNQTDNSFFSVGLLQQFDFGLSGKMVYNYSHTTIHGASRAFVPVNDFYDGIATLELSQSLWRNLWGRETRSQQSIIASQSLATKHAESYKQKVILAQAESIYWSLSQIRKVVKVQKESLDRALKLRSWNQRRLSSGLAENADFLQADANVKSKEYELKNAQQEEKNLQRALNSLRGINNDTVSEELELVNAEKVKHLAVPAKSDLRDDTRAAFELQNIARANADISAEKNKPLFELYGTMALNGRDQDKNEAISNSFTTEHDTKAIGIRFTAPLDFTTTKANISGYKKEKLAAEHNYQRKLFEQEQLWDDLVTRFEDAKVKLTLVEKIEEAQKIKATNERDRLNRGRTVTFQVLNFEQDYAQSELLRIQSETNILNIYAQLKTFGAGGAK